jgi:hypothetical protein
MRDSPAPCDATVHLVASEETAALEADATRLLDRLGGLIDRERTELVVSTEVTIVPGHAPVFVLMPNTRRPALTHDQFIDTWYGGHAELGKAAGVARYRQHHTRMAETEKASRALGLPVPLYDGIGTSYFLDVAEGVAAMSAEAVAKGAIEDEKRFIDHSRSSFGLYQDVFDNLV